MEAPSVLLNVMLSWWSWMEKSGVSRVCHSGWAVLWEAGLVGLSTVVC